MHDQCKLDAPHFDRRHNTDFNEKPAVQRTKQ